LHGGTVNRHLARKEVALVGLPTVGGDGVDLVRLVVPVYESLSAAPAPAATDHDHVTDPARPLALNAKKIRPQIHDQVVAFVVERT